MVQKMKSSGCLYGLSGQGVHFLYQSQLLPAFLTVCNAVANDNLTQNSAIFSEFFVRSSNLVYYKRQNSSLFLRRNILMIRDYGHNSRTVHHHSRPPSLAFFFISNIFMLECFFQRADDDVV